ncbi:MAG: hypothetical protein F7C32_01120 [Desulfurococcales archaeon]|nr:hypothetical protein [Desulfurococcales archaeon]
MARNYYECSVCGRKFPVGQGIVVSKAGITLYFHSNRCASKFLRLFLERMGEEEARRVLRELLEELSKALEEKRKEKTI